MKHLNEDEAKLVTISEMKQAMRIQIELRERYRKEKNTTEDSVKKTIAEAKWLNADSNVNTILRSIQLLSALWNLD